MIELDPNRTALLVMDYQTSILGRIGEKSVGLLNTARSVIAKARSAHVPVIFVVVSFRPGYPEVSPRNASFAALSKSGGLTGAPGADIHEAVRPLEDEVLVVKRRISAFAGSDLEWVLRARALDTLVLMGVSTSGVVLSTTRQAADADYRIVTVQDGCADADDEVHRVLMDKVFVRQATVVPAIEVLTAFEPR